MALDLLIHTVVARPELEARRILKRVILISDFSTAVTDVDPDFIAAVVGQLQDRDALLEVIYMKYSGERPITWPWSRGHVVLKYRGLGPITCSLVM